MIEKFLQALLAQTTMLVEGLIYGLRLFTRRRQTILYGTTGALANGATGTVTIQLPAESNGVIEQILATSTGTFTCKIQKSDDDRYITDSAIPNTLLFAKAAEHYNGVKNLFFGSSAKLTLECLNNSGSSNTIEFAVYIRYI